MKRPTGYMDLQVFRAGRLIEQARTRNLVVDAAASIKAKLLGGQTAGNAITQVGFGAGTAAAAAGNTALTNPYIKNIDAVTFPGPGLVAFLISLGSFEAIGDSIAEFGLLTGNGALYARLVRAAPLLKDGITSLSAIWTIDLMERD